MVPNLQQTLGRHFIDHEESVADSVMPIELCCQRTVENDEAFDQYLRTDFERV